MKKITPHELRSWQRTGHNFVLVDVREGWERDVFNIGGIHIPVGDILQQRNEIPRDADVVVYCEKGIRSSIVIQRLEGMGFQNLINLSGGMQAWKAANL